MAETVNLTTLQKDYVKKHRQTRWMVLLGPSCANMDIQIETGSFDEAKAKYLSLLLAPYTNTPSDLLLVRVVDPWIGIYPVN